MSIWRSFWGSGFTLRFATSCTGASCAIHLASRVLWLSEERSQCPAQPESRGRATVAGAGLLVERRALTGHTRLHYDSTLLLTFLTDCIFAQLLSITFELLVHFLSTEEGTISRPHHGGLQTRNAPNGTLLSKERTALPEQTVKKHMQRYNAGLIRPNKTNHADQPLRRSTSILGRAPT